MNFSLIVIQPHEQGNYELESLKGFLIQLSSHAAISLAQHSNSTVDQENSLYSILEYATSLLSTDTLYPHYTM